MRNWKPVLACLALCAVTLYLVDRRIGMLGNVFERLDHKIDRISEAIKPMTATWNSGGVSHTLGPVHSLPGEKPAAYAARFQALLAEEMANFPPDVPQ